MIDPVRPGFSQRFAAGAEVDRLFRDAYLAAHTRWLVAWINGANELILLRPANYPCH